MTKECEVILNNKAVTVVKFDGKEIQFPSIHRNAKTVFVKFDNGSYSIVNNIDDDPKDNGAQAQTQKKSRAYKKTTDVTNNDLDEGIKSIKDSE